MDPSGKTAIICAHTPRGTLLMRRTAIYLFAALLGSFPLQAAHASFVPPTCHKLSPEERERETDVSGLATLVDVSCTCSQTAPCTKYLRFSSTTKGMPGTGIVKYTESLQLDFGVTPEYCAKREEEARMEVGTSKEYSFSVRSDVYTPVPTQRCE